MKTLTYLLFTAFLLSSCIQEPSSHEEHDHSSGEHEHGTDEHEEESVHLSPEQVKELDLKITSLTQRNMAAVVEASGSLEVPPQNEAIVTAIVGANINTIKVIEGEEVKKGQVLATLTHPNLLIIQTDYIAALSQFEYATSAYQRQQKLYDEKVGSGEQLQLAKASFLTLQGTVKGLEFQLKLLGLNPKSLAEGNLVESVPVKSPIDGYVQKVHVKMAQFVKPETEMFEVINLNHIHADLMVFEKDVNKVKKGQKIRFTVEASNDEFNAEIYAVGKSFEQDPKAVHIHAEIENKEGHLLPGMYIQGQILVSNDSTTVLPSEAIVRQGNGLYIFQLTGKNKEEWSFKPVEVKTGVEANGFTEVIVPKALIHSHFAANKAYYLMAELKKEEAGHGHSH